MAGWQTENTDTVEGVADYEIEKNACSTAHVDDHDDDRSGPSCLRISACISVLFHSPVHDHLNAHLPPECPHCNLSHIILLPPSDPRLPFTPLCSLPTSRQHLGQAKRAFFLLSFGTISAGNLPFLPLCNQKKTCNQNHFLPPPSFFASQHAHTHLLCSLIYVSIAPGGIYLAPKRRISLGKGGSRAPDKKPFVVSKYFIVVPVQRTIIKFIKKRLFCCCKKSHF